MNAAVRVPSSFILHPSSLFLVLIPFAAAAGETAAIVPPPVARVVLYPDAAMVSRIADVRCAEGTAIAAFPGLPPSLDPGTFRASAPGAKVEGLSATERVRRDPWSAEIRDLEAQLEALRARDAAAERRAERAAAARASALSLRGAAAPFIAREGALEPKPAVEAWAAALDATRAAIEAADAAVRAADAERRELSRRLDELQRRRDELAGAAPPRAWDVEVIVRCNTKTRVELSYVTGAARWSPAYEARLDEAAGTVAVTVLADARQETGEDWKDVSVALSTAQSRRDARPPKPQRLLVRAEAPQESKKVLVARREDVSHLEEAAQPAGGEGAVRAEDQGVSVRLEVPGKAGLAGDGHAVRLPVETLRWPAQLALVAVPKALPAVFHSATTTSGAKYPFPPGPVDLFNAAGFLGTAAMPRTASGERLELAFGIDESVKVRRTVLREDNEATGLLGKGRRMSHAYRIDLENHGKAPATVTLREHVPVSELDDVTVAVAKETTPGYEQVASDGLLTWKVGVPAAGARSVELHFEVEIPSKYDAAGL